MAKDANKPLNPQPSSEGLGVLSFKPCGKCGELNRGKPRKSSPHGDCKTCAKKRAAKWLEENKDRKAKANNVWHKKNSQKVITRVSDYKKNNKAKANAICTKARLKRINRVPKWLSNDDKWIIEEIYSLSSLRSKVTGIKWYVDHILPLCGKTVSGLHVPSNLQVIPALENVRKGNRI